MLRAVNRAVAFAKKPDAFHRALIARTLPNIPSAAKAGSILSDLRRD
jgi:hypothetical protein